MNLQPRVPHRLSRTKSRAAMTLVELLVVVSIVVIVIAIMVPLMQPAVKGRKVREATRQINAYLLTAKAKAAENGRPFGVWFQSAVDGDGNPTGYGLEIGMAEIPAPYAGDSYNSRAKATGTYTVTLDNSAAGLANDMISAGDLIQFNSQEPFYQITSVDKSSGNLSLANRPGRSLFPTPPKLDPVVGGLFKVYRRPAKAGTKTIQFPRGAVLDMRFCGTGTSAWQANWGAVANQPVFILFSPSGRVDSLTVGGSSSRVTDTIYLLVGQPKETVDGNLSDGDSRWVAINSLNGHVITARNALATNVVAAREIASQAISSGGKQ